MFSNDRNIERIADFIEELKHWLMTRKEYAELDIVEKVVKICTALTLIVVISLLVMLILIYLSFAAAFALETVLGSVTLGFLVVDMAYICLLLIIYALRHTLVERPLVRFFVSILADKD